MSKPRAVQWLEDQTGQSIDVAPEAVGVQERHLSVRLTSDLALGLDALASERGLTVSQLVRELLNEAVRQRASVARWMVVPWPNGSPPMLPKSNDAWPADIAGR